MPPLEPFAFPFLGPAGVGAVDQFLAVGQAVTGLVTGPGPDQDAYLVTAAGLRPLP